MVVQFFIALVEAINRQEKRFGIGNVDGHGQLQRTARFPHGIEAWIVYFHERCCALAQEQP